MSDSSPDKAAGKAGPSVAWVGKAVALAFTAVLAPILVAFGVKQLGSGPAPVVVHVVPGSDAKPPAVEPARHDPVVLPPTVPAFVPPPPEATKPKEAVVHLAGDLSPWVMFEKVGDAHIPMKDIKEPEKLFAVPKIGLLHAPGPRAGALVSKALYENYRLAFDYKWTAGGLPEKARARRAGVTLHAVEAADQKTWMPGMVCLLTDGNAGSLRLLADPGKLACTSAVRDSIAAPGLRAFKPTAAPKRLELDGKWSGVIHRLGFFNPGEEIPKDDPELINDWNHVECTCEGNAVSVSLNGKPVTAVTELTVRRGKLVIWTEGADVMFRKMTLTSIKK